jgi:hypothetical protein
LVPLETTNLGGQITQAGARVLKPLLEALSSTGSGRMELVRDAFDRGVFCDLRLVKPALNGIDDPYPEIAGFLAENVLPLYGKAIVPELRAKIDLKGRGGHLHRLHLLHELDAEASRDLIQQALAEGSKEMKVAAIECLGSSDEDLVYLLEQSKAKARDVRAAALRAMVSAGTSANEVIATLKKAIAGADLELLISRVKQCELPLIRDYVLEQAEAQYALLRSTTDKVEQGPAVIRMQQLVSCLDKRTDAPAEAFLLKCFDNAKTFSAIKSEPSGSDLNEMVAQVLSVGTPKMRQRLIAAHPSLEGGMLPPAIAAARDIMSPADFYTEFSPLMKAIPEKPTKKNTVQKERASALLGALTSRRERVYSRAMSAWRYEKRDHKTHLRELDPRWLDAAVEAESLQLVCQLARPGHPPTNRFLSAELAKAGKPHESSEVLRTMTRIAHPDTADAIIQRLKKQAEEASHYYLSYWFGPLIAALPVSEYPKFEQLLTTLPEKMVDQLMDSVMALKNKTE